MHLIVPTTDIEIVSDELWAAGVSGVEERSNDATSVLLVASFEDHLESTIGVLFGGRSDGGVRELDGDQWADTWREWARPAHIAGSLWVSPVWLQLELGSDDAPDEGADVLALEPGHAWGHGAHPTTVLSARELVDHVVDGASVLDVGCGSGVLTLVAASRGAVVTACDVDPEALVVTQANAELNDLGGRVRVSSDSLQAIARAEPLFDIVVANIGLAEFRHVAADLLACSAPNGSLILSGVLDDQLAELEETMAPAQLTSVREDAGWIAATFVANIS